MNFYEGFKIFSKIIDICKIQSKRAFIIICLIAFPSSLSSSFGRCGSASMSSGRSPRMNSISSSPFRIQKLWSTIAATIIVQRSSGFFNRSSSFRAGNRRFRRPKACSMHTRVFACRRLNTLIFLI